MNQNCNSINYCMINVKQHHHRSFSSNSDCFCETDFDNCIIMNKIKFNMYVELSLVFMKDKSVCFYFFVKINLLSVLVTQDYTKEFLFLQIKSKLTIVFSLMYCILITLVPSWLSVEKTSCEEEKQ